MRWYYRVIAMGQCDMGVRAWVLWATVMGLPYVRIIVSHAYYDIILRDGIMGHRVSGRVM